MDLPKVDSKIYARYSTSIDVCLTEAIELKKDLAVINTEECTYCRSSEEEYQVEAIG